MQLKLPYIFQLLIAVLLFSACTNKTTNPAPKHDDSKHLNIGVMSSMDYLPLAIAQANGLFESEGVAVTIHKFYSANERDAAFQSNNLDGTILDYTGAAIQRAGGVKLKLTSQCDGSFVLIARKESNINSASNLAGKKVAVSRNTVIDYCTDLVLQNARVRLESIQRVEINKIPLRLEMLRNGKIDATMLPDPFATIALQDGNRKIGDIAEMDVHVTGIAFHESAIAQKREAIQNFYQAYNQAVVYINSQPQTDFESILISEIGVPIDIVSKIELPIYTLAQLPAEKDLNSVEKWLKTKKLVTPDFDINTAVEAGLTP